jgi:uncharacterized protein
MAMRAARKFQIFAKPVGSICNLDCRYCYYLGKEYLYPDGAPVRMPDDVLENYIVQHIEATPGPEVAFSWHGGEPTVLGLDYFRKIVSLQRRHTPAGHRVTNGIQTNGFLLDEEWCRFFAAEHFGVGLSLDGPQEMHDRYRLTKGGQGSHRQALQALKLLRRFRIPFDILCVVNDYNVRYPTQVYRFFKENGTRYIGFLPAVEWTPEAPGGISACTVPARAYGIFLCTIFDEWVRQDVGRIRVQIFEEAVRPAQGMDHSLCIFRETCGDIPVIEHNGDLFSCDHYVDEKHRLGNIGQVPLVELLEHPAQRAFGQAKKDSLPRCCRECEVLAMCNGGCPKDRFLLTPDGEAGLNYLCEGLKIFFTHSIPYLIQLSSLEHVESSHASRTQLARTTLGARFPGAGRNESCPCGSGRKYKKCCLNKIP